MHTTESETYTKIHFFIRHESDLYTLGLYNSVKKNIILQKLKQLNETDFHLYKCVLEYNIKSKKSVKSIFRHVWLALCDSYNKMRLV